jgi:transcription antitermination factor NusG
MIARQSTKDVTVMEFSDESHKNWFVLFTASNNEKQVERHLQRRELESFLPLHTVVRRWKNRTTVKVQLPLFAGYVFARFARIESWRVLEIPMVYSIVGNRNGAVAIPDAEVEALRVGLAGGQAEPHPTVTVGSKARVRTGALAGWEGIVTRADSGLRIVLTVESIKRSFAVHVSTEDIDLLDEDFAKR